MRLITIADVIAIKVIEHTSFIDFLKFVKFCVSFSVPNMNVRRKPWGQREGYVDRSGVDAQFEVVLVTEEDEEVDQGDYEE